MHQLPNWFRWGIIILATLIMCACRAPLQSGQPLLPPIVSSQEAISAAEADSTTAGSQTGQDWQPQPVGDTVQPLSGGAFFLDTTFQSQAHQAVPVVSAALMEVDAKLEPELTLPNPVPISDVPVAPEPADLEAVPSPSTDPIYVAINDTTVVSETSEELRLAQIDSTDDEVPSPFTDDPVEAESSEVQTDVLDENNGDASEAIVEGETIIESPTDMGLQHSYQGFPIEEDLDEAPLECVDVAGDSVATGGVIVEEMLPGCLADLGEPALEIPHHELARLYPDEYICDGGDAAAKVGVGRNWSLHGLDPEDTIGHYDTLDQRVVVEPSNRVCIYAPRFAAARKVISPFQNEGHSQVLSAERQALAVVEQARQNSDSYTKTVSAQRHLRLQPPSTLRNRQPGVEGIYRKALHVLDHDLSLHENLRVLKFGVHKQSEKAQLAEFSAKAVAWSHDKAVQVMLDEVIPQTRVSRRGTDSIFILGDNRPAKLRVLKTASTADALPGEEVAFTLRFDNVGFQPIGNVTIVDNLATRLEFIEGSDLCSVDSEFLHDENEVESLTLRWEIQEPIEPGKGGLIRFRCRVR